MTNRQRCYAAFILVLLTATLCHSQTTAVTLQVTDLDLQTWNTGTWSVQLYSPPGVPCCTYNVSGGTTSVPNQTQSGFLSGTGGATFALTPNTSIVPTNTQWMFNVCPQAYPVQCFTKSFVITGVSQTVTINPPAIRINISNPVARVAAYTDLEVTNGNLGSQYFNLVDNLVHVCSAFTSVCSFLPISGGSGANFASPPPLGNVTPNTIAATNLSVVGSGVFFTPQSSCAFGGIDNSLDELEDANGVPMWLPNGALGPCTQILNFTPLPVGVNPTDKQVVAWDEASGQFTIQTQIGGGGGGLSGMTAGQVPIAATPTTATSSKAIQGTDTSLMSSGTMSGIGARLCLDANNGATTSGCSPVYTGTAGVQLQDGPGTSGVFVSGGDVGIDDSAGNQVELVGGDVGSTVHGALFLGGASPTGVDLRSSDGNVQLRAFASSINKTAILSGTAFTLNVPLVTTGATFSGISGSTQCLHVNTSGLVSGTGSDCGSGTVTTFSAGNLTPLFTTSVSTATTTPALSFTLSNAAANTILANFTGISAAPTYSNINGGASCGDATHALSYTNGTGFGCQAITASSVVWSALTNPASSLSLTMGANTSTFNTTTAVSQFFKWANTTAAVVGASQSSSILSLCGTEFHAAASVEGCFAWQFVPGTGTDAANTFAFTHTGSATGVTTTTFPGPLQAGSAGGAGGTISLPEGTTATASTGNDVCYGDSTAHAVKCAYNNGTFQIVPLISSTTTTTTQALYATATAGVFAPRATTLGDLPSIANATFLSNVSGAGAVPSANTLPTTLNSLVKTSTVNGALAASLTTDDGTTSTYTGTGGTKSPTFTSTGTTAGFVDYPQGTTSAAVAPCNTATSICEQSPTAVTSYMVTKPGTAASGLPAGTNAAGVVTQNFTGSAAFHAGPITIGSGASIAATSLCSTANCPAGDYDVSVYIEVTTACTTTGTYVVWLGYTDDAGAKTGSGTTTSVPLFGNGTTPMTSAAGASLALTSTANYGTGHFFLHTTGAATSALGAINYGTTATACGTGGPMVGKMFLTVVPLS